MLICKIQSFISFNFNTSPTYIILSESLIYYNQQIIIVNYSKNNHQDSFGFASHRFKRPQYQCGQQVLYLSCIGIPRNKIEDSWKGIFYYLMQLLGNHFVISFRPVVVKFDFFATQLVIITLMQEFLILSYPVLFNSFHTSQEIFFCRIIEGFIYWENFYFL